MRLAFLSSNPHKIMEVRSIFESDDIVIVPIEQKIEEIQTNDMQSLVRDKCIKAFRNIGRPLFVEHTGLYISALNELPAGLTQIFWDSLKADKISELFGSLADTKVIAKTRIGYCDGKRIHQFEGKIEGSIAKVPKGDRDFQWDCIFIPKGESRTFAEMGEEKNKISMRRRALDNFADFLRSSLHA